MENYTTEEQYGTAPKKLTKEEIYLNLAECSDKEIKEVYKLCGFKNILPTNMFVRYSTHYEVWGKYDNNGGKTQVSFKQFKEIMGATETSVERHIAFETEYQLEEFRKIQSEYFDEYDKCYTGIRLSGNIMERMLKLINQLHKELTTN